MDDGPFGMCKVRQAFKDPPAAEKKPKCLEERVLHLSQSNLFSSNKSGQVKHLLQTPKSPKRATSN